MPPTHSTRHHLTPHASPSSLRRFLSERALHSNSLSIPTRSPSLATVVFQPGRGSVARRHPAPTRRPVTTYSARRIPQDCYAREGQDGGAARRGVGGWRWWGWGWVGVALCSQTPCSRADEPRAEAKTWGRSHVRAEPPSRRRDPFGCESTSRFTRECPTVPPGPDRVCLPTAARRGNLRARFSRDQIVCAWARPERPATSSCGHTVVECRKLETMS